MVTSFNHQFYQRLILNICVRSPVLRIMQSQQGGDRVKKGVGRVADDWCDSNLRLFGQERCSPVTFERDWNQTSERSFRYSSPNASRRESASLSPLSVGCASFETSWEIDCCKKFLQLEPMNLTGHMTGIASLPLIDNEFASPCDGENP